MMTPERFNQLFADEDASLTDEEISLGWHWCHGQGHQLVGPGTLTYDPEWNCCASIRAIRHMRPNSDPQYEIHRLRQSLHEARELIKEMASTAVEAEDMGGPAVMHVNMEAFYAARKWLEEHGDG